VFFAAKGCELESQPVKTETADEGFLGELETSPITTPEQTCLRCSHTFTTRNQLYRHLKASRYMTSDGGGQQKNQPPSVLDSSAEPLIKLEQGLSDFQFTEIIVSFAPGDQTRYQVCADTAFGNSGVDAGLLKKIQAVSKETVL
jgi:hypothetical protein